MHQVLALDHATLTLYPGWRACARRKPPLPIKTHRRPPPPPSHLTPSSQPSLSLSVSADVADRHGVQSCDRGGAGDSVGVGPCNRGVGGDAGVGGGVGK
jgi:hypothetical protein